MSVQRDPVIQMPNMAQLGGQQPNVPAFTRAPFYPTAPFYSTRNNIGYQPRFYGASLITGETDYSVGTEALRIVQFDMPCTIVAINGGALDTDDVTTLSGINPLSTFLFRVEYSTGDKLMTAARLASTCIGTQENPGEIGNSGYTIQPGASVVLGITPLLADLRIDITLVCLEARGPSNYTVGG